MNTISGSGLPASECQRFPKTFRLRTAEDFKRVYSYGKKHASKSFVVFSIRNGLEYSRFGLTISRKLGKANRRNRTKRRIKEVLRISRDTLPMGFDFVLNPRRSAANQHFEDLSKELISLFGAEK